MPNKPSMTTTIRYPSKDENSGHYFQGSHNDRVNCFVLPSRDPVSKPGQDVYLWLNKI